MHKIFATLAIASLSVGAAHAADKPVIAPPPPWVKPVAVPPVPAKTDDAAIRVLLSDQQVSLEPGRQTIYTEVAIRIQTPQGLSAGNVSLPWRPETDVLTVHKLLIRRGATTIDVLASGQTFTVLRRETNLESATLDGVLTANIQPEGVQVGDIVEFAASVTSSDPVLMGHVEQIAGGWSVPILRAHLRMQWPATVPVRYRQSAALPVLRPVRTGGIKAVELSLEDVQPYVPPKGAPLRYALGRIVETTDFASWADLAKLMAPLYERAAVIPAQGALRTELDRIAAASSDPRQRAQAALALVQDRVRYVALAMGSGGLVPTAAETTWARRYGDCKGKTVLLLALLHALGVAAEPVGVNATVGDGLDARLPAVGAFDHVLVRATVAGKTYWLDGTRSADTNLDRLTVPPFAWGLPLTARGAALVRMLPVPLDEPGNDVAIRIDATGGLTPPAPTTVEIVLRGDEAVSVSQALSNLAGEARDRALRDYWKGQYDFIDVKTATARFDAATGEQHLSMTGMARMEWKDGWYETDGTSVGYKADFSRDPGPDRDAPYAVPYPYYNRTVETILLPAGFAGAKAGPQEDVDVTVAGIAYRRHATLVGTTFRIERTERSVAPEFAAKDAPAAQKTLRDLSDKRVYIRKPPGYRPTAGELASMLADTPTTASGFVDRGNVLLEQSRFAEAIKDFDRGVALDPKNSIALADRGIARVWLNEPDAANKDLDAALALDPRNAVVFRARGLAAQRAGKPGEAVTAYTASLAIEPGNSFALTNRAQAEHAMGDDVAALRDAAVALTAYPRSTELYLLRANILRRQGKADEALAEARAVAAASPDDAYAQVVSARIYDTFGKSTEATRAYDRAIALKPEAYIYINRSMSRPRTDFAGRAQDLDAAFKLEPDSTDVLAARAQLQSDRGDHAAAVTTLSAMLAKTPDNLDLLMSRGVTYARIGDTLRAEQDFAAVRTAKATNAFVFNSMCWAKATAGVALDSALGDCDAALKAAPGNASYLDSRALVLLRLGRVDEAIAAYDRALAVEPAQPSSLFGRALAWGRKGDKAKAAPDAAAAERGDPDIRRRFTDYGLTS